MHAPRALRILSVSLATLSLGTANAIRVYPRAPLQGGTQPPLATVTHPRIPDAFDETTYGRRHTNRFYADLLYQDTATVHVLPYVITTDVAVPPYGMHVSIPTKIYGPLIDETRIKWYSNANGNDLGFGAAEFNGPPSVRVILTDRIGFSATISLERGASSIQYPLVRGMAFFTAVFGASTTPVVYTGRAIRTINGRDPAGAHAGKRFKIALDNGQTWIVYTNHDTVFNLDGSKLVCSLSCNALILRAAFVPANAAPDAESILDSYSGAYPTGCDMQVNVDDVSGAYTFNWNVKYFTGTNSKLLHFALPHHVIKDGVAPPTDYSLNSTTKGPMTARVGDSWTLVEAVEETPWLPDVSRISASKRLVIIDILRQEIKDFDATRYVSGGSIYFSGQQVDAHANLCLLAEAFELVDDLKTCKWKIQRAFALFTAPTYSNALVYDKTWGGTISAKGLCDGCSLADFGNSYYNDHNFHYSYWTAAAAKMCRLDAVFCQQYRPFVETMIRDYINPSVTDKYYPTFRSFDWFVGHSWARGILPTSDGKDQESFSEDVHSVYAMALWGAIIGDVQLDYLGRLMISVMSRTVNKYALMDPQDGVHPAKFVGNKVVGIYFEEKCDYTTYFGNNVEYIHGIQQIPVSGVTDRIRKPDFIESEWNLLRSVAPGLTSFWKSILYTNYAAVNPTESFNVLLTSPIDDGLTRSWSLYWAAAHDAQSPSPSPGIKPTSRPSASPVTPATPSAPSATKAPSRVPTKAPVRGSPAPSYVVPPGCQLVCNGPPNAPTPAVVPKVPYTTLLSTCGSSHLAILNFHCGSDCVNGFVDVVQFYICPVTQQTCGFSGKIDATKLVNSAGRGFSLYTFSLVLQPGMYHYYVLYRVDGVEKNTFAVDWQRETTYKC